MTPLPARIALLTASLLPLPGQAVELFVGLGAHAALPDCAGCADKGGGSVTLGARFLPEIGLEGSFQTFGQRREKTESSNRVDTDTYTTLGAAFGLTGQIPLGEAVRLEWRAGAHVWSVIQRHESCTRSSSTARWHCDKSHDGSIDDGFDPYAGLGIELRLGPLVSLEGHYTRFRFTEVLGRYYVDNAGAGVRFRF